MSKTIHIAIQGYPGAFHEIAARHFFDQADIQIIPCDTFADVIQQVHEGGVADTGLMAIENSIAGSLLPNFGLIHTSSVKIVGEIYLRIKQNLMTLSGSDMSNITEVHSHYMAIAQCKSYFNQYPHIKLVETKDTAESAKLISHHKLNHVGAIASDLAAELYQLDIIAPGIETNKQNYTRFFVIEGQQSGTDISTFNKVSAAFTIRHETGSLYNTLGVLNTYKANLSKIQSTPISNQPWEYLFFIDFIIKDNSIFDELIDQLNNVTHDLKILGKYKSGLHYEH